MIPDNRKPAPRSPETVNWADFIQNTPDTPLQQSGLVDLNYSGESIALRELSGIALLRIRSLQPYPAIRNKMVSCDIALPADVNQSLGQDPAAMCLAPGEWLLFSEYLGCKRLYAQVQAAVEPRHTVALDLSDAFTVFRLSGNGSSWLLNKLSALDFQKDISCAPRCARTRLQQVAVTLHYHQPGGLATAPVLDLIFDRSLARYMWQLMVASAPHAEELELRFGSRSSTGPHLF